MQNWRGILLAIALLATTPRPALAAPDEDLLGRAAGYPLGNSRTWFFDETVRVGSFSQLDRILPHHTLGKAAQAVPLEAGPGDFASLYRFDGRTFTLEDFLARQRVTGMLVLKEGRILFERYQYKRTAAHRFVSHSMAKSLVSLAVGLALEEKRIASLDDRVSMYATELAGSAYGDTSIRHLLRMSSGVRFTESYDGKDDLAKFARVRGANSTVEAVRIFSDRAFEAGTRFKYASSETVVLAVLLRAVTGRTLSGYLTERLWQPLGAEGDATWVRSRDGLESAAGGFNAVLRDYGRLGLMLADDGAVAGRQIIPKEYLLEATDWHRHPEAFAPGKATPYFGYGYQFWTFPGEKRRFALLGVYGQSIFVDPGNKLVMVVTAAARNASVGKEPFARERDAVWRGLVGSFGSW